MNANAHDNKTCGKRQSSPTRKGNGMVYYPNDNAYICLKIQNGEPQTPEDHRREDQELENL